MLLSNMVLCVLSSPTELSEVSNTDGSCDGHQPPAARASVPARVGAAFTGEVNELPASRSPAQGASSQLPQPGRVPAHSHPPYRPRLWVTHCCFCIHKSTLYNVPSWERCNKIHSYYWNINTCLQRNVFFC